MTFWRSCKFYENSKCSLQGGYCDLGCNQTRAERSIKSYDEIDPFTQWQMGEDEGLGKKYYLSQSKERLI
jgi:hypothetical protein